MDNEIINCLVSADAALAKLIVSGENVFFLAVARTHLKTAYDAIGKLKNEKEVMEEDGR